MTSLSQARPSILALYGSTSFAAILAELKQMEDMLQLDGETSMAGITEGYDQSQATYQQYFNQGQQQERQGISSIVSGATSFTFTAGSYLPVDALFDGLPSQIDSANEEVTNIEAWQKKAAASTSTGAVIAKGPSVNPAEQEIEMASLPSRPSPAATAPAAAATTSPTAADTAAADSTITPSASATSTDAAATASTAPTVTPSPVAQTAAPETPQPTADATTPEPRVNPLLKPSGINFGKEPLPGEPGSSVTANDLSMALSQKGGENVNAEIQSQLTKAQNRLSELRNALTAKRSIVTNFGQALGGVGSGAAQVTGANATKDSAQYAEEASWHGTLLQALNSMCQQLTSTAGSDFSMAQSSIQMLGQLGQLGTSA